ncbi:MAG TPA: hypothetical protein VFS22_09640 [Flavisolibacter sp.]|nr:hypothetical protein [Flavisolibacter sp.]
MRQQISIQKIIAFVLLVVFSISVAPKAYFHDAIAHHKDVVVCHHPEGLSACVHSQPFHCHFDDLVVTAPFLIQAVPHSFFVEINYLDKQDQYNTSYTFSSLYQKAGRGPPAG